MATLDPISDLSTPPAPPGAGLLVLLAAMPPEYRQSVLGSLAAAFPGEELLIASPDASPEEPAAPFRLIPAPASKVNWTLTAADFVSAYQLAEKNEARAILMLSPESAARSRPPRSQAWPTPFSPPPPILPSPATICRPTPAWSTPPSSIRLPARCSPRACASPGSRHRPFAAHGQRLAGAAQRFTVANQGETPVWPVNEAAVAGFSVEQFDVSPRLQSHPNRGRPQHHPAPVTGSLFSDIDAKAAFLAALSPRCRRRFKLPSPGAPADDGLSRSPPCCRPFASPTPTSRRSGRSSCRRIRCSASNGSRDRRRGIPHARQPLGAHRLRLSARLPAPHHQPRTPSRRADSALPRMGRQPHQHHRLRRRPGTPH
jgi:hypothetical protein